MFEIEHIAANQVYFYEFNSKKSANFAAYVRGVTRKSFNFQKITWNFFLKISFFYINEHS